MNLAQFHNLFIFYFLSNPHIQLKIRTSSASVRVLQEKELFGEYNTFIVSVNQT